MKPRKPETASEAAPKDATASEPAKPATVRGRVWALGELHMDGLVFKAGAEVELSEEFAKQLGEVFIPE